MHELWKLGCLKCWYSEAELKADQGEVEHFRPKKKVWKSTPPHGGYWWRAFDWHNFRLAHPDVNKRRKDYSTDEVAGKGCYFPLRDELKRASNLADEVNEEPILLDPTVAHDCLLLCFDESSGKPIPRYKPEDDIDSWRYRRAKESINFYHLDEGTWNANRADLMLEVGILCDQIHAASLKGDTTEYNKLCDSLGKYIGSHSEFSSAATQVLNDKVLTYHQNPPIGLVTNWLKDMTQSS